MTPDERIASLEARLAALEGRIALIEARDRSAPGMPNPASPWPSQPGYPPGQSPVWCSGLRPKVYGGETTQNLPPGSVDFPTG